MEEQKALKQRWFRYVGQPSEIIAALPDGMLFRRKDGYYVSENEEVLVKRSSESDLLFTSTTKSSTDGNNK